MKRRDHRGVGAPEPSVRGDSGPLHGPSPDTQIAGSVKGTIDHFLFELYPKLRSRMNFESRPGICTKKYPLDNPNKHHSTKQTIYGD
jgi:hypothetical protein